MATHDEKAYLHCRINRIKELLLEIEQEISKWQIEPPTELEEE